MRLMEGPLSTNQASVLTDTALLRRDLAVSPKPQAGFFLADGVVRKVHRELVIYAAGPRALLLQYAHPQVAAGLRHHSELQSRPIRRLIQTFQTIETMIFGTRSQATRAAHRTSAHHSRVQGVLTEAQGRYCQGASYSAATPELLLWVLATLIDSSLSFYDALVAPLDLSAREQYYQEIRAASPLLGLTPEQMPPCYADFCAYFNSTLTDGSLSVGEAGRGLAAALLDPRTLGAPLSFAARTLAAATLPERLRAEYGLAWGRRERLTARALIATLRTLAWVMPLRVRGARPWRVAWNSAAKPADRDTPALSFSIWLRNVFST